MSNLLTVSRLRTWRDCRRKHRLMYLDGFRPVAPGESLRFGTLIHVGLEGWWKADDGERAARALQAIEGRGYDEFEQMAANALLIGYDERWRDDDRYEVLGVEESFFAPLLNPETGAASRTWTLAGKLDGRLRDRVTGERLILEHKTTSDSLGDDADPYWTKLGMDAQVSHYYMGAESLGFPADGCLYDVLRKPQQQPLKATPVEKRKYKQNGELYARQRDRDETPAEYGERIRLDIEADPDKYFRRRPIARTHSDLIEYLGDAWAEGRMIREAELAGRAPRNPESCHRFGTCSFWGVCAHGIRPEEHPEAFERVENVHPELDLQEVA